MALRVLIIGANRGLGLELVRQYQARGDAVWATCRRPADAVELRALIGPERVVELAVTDAASIASAVAAVGRQTSALDVFFHNAGVADMAELSEVTAERMMALLEVNTVAPLMVTKAFLPLIRAGSAPKVALMSSLLGSIASKTELPKGGYPYSVSKAGLNMVARMLATDLNPEGIAVIPMSPGWVQTDMGGPEAPLQPAESIAGMISVLDHLTPEQSDRCWHYDGSVLAW